METAKEKVLNHGKEIKIVCSNWVISIVLTIGKSLNFFGPDNSISKKQKSTQIASRVFFNTGALPYMILDITV